MNVRTLSILMYLITLHTCHAQQSFMVGGWVPYWRSEAGTATTHRHITLFDQVSPFAYEVQKDGSILDRFVKKYPLWNNLLVASSKQATLLIPTLAWHTTEELHEVLSHTKKRELHIQHILHLVTSNNFAGINVNYERISPHDRKHFIEFLETLSEKLHAEYKLLHVTLGPRTSDTTTHLINNHESPQTNSFFISLSPVTGTTTQNFKNTIARCSDQIIIMGYDEWGIPYNRAPDYRKKNYYVSHASNQWVEQVITYALTFIPPEKLVLGVPTYGLEFSITHQLFTTRISIEKRRSLLFTGAQNLAQEQQKKPHRTPGGELSFTYIHENGEKRHVVYCDAQTIKDKIALCKKYRLKGMYLFAIYGSEDPEIWNVLQKTRAKVQS